MTIKVITEMSAIDLDKLSKQDLQRLIKKSKHQLKRMDKRDQRTSLKSSDARVVAIANQVRQLSDELKISKKETLKAVAGNLRIAIKDARSTPKPRVKYRHPEDPGKTWSGMGARPKWLRDELEKGHKINEFKV